MTYPQIDPVAIQLGPIAIHWYGLMYLAAFVGCGLLISRRARRADLPLAPGLISDLINTGALGVILGGRLGYMLFYDLQAWIQDPLKVLRIWDGGMSFHGGLIGVVLALVVFARKHNESIIRVGDLIAPTVPLGLMFGRIGNFIGGELWGRPTDSPMGMIFPHVDQQLRHPSQLYQAAGEGLVLFALCMWFARKPRPAGQVAGVFLMGYAVFRSLAEFAREPDAHIGVLSIGLTMGQLLSVPMFLAGIMIFAKGPGWAKGLAVR